MDVILDFIKDQFQLLGLVVYIVYNEFKRWRHVYSEETQEKEDLIKYKATSEEEKHQQAINQALEEVERYVFNQLKMYKSRILENSKAEHGLVKMATDDIFLTGLVKSQRNIMTHIKGNGYHELSNTELEDYVKYLAREVIDTLLNCADKHKAIEDVTELIVEHEIIDMVRNIVDTSIGVHTRLLSSYDPCEED